MKKRRLHTLRLLAFVSMFFQMFSHAASAETVPKPGSKDRVAICNAIRKEAFSEEAKAGRFVEFVISSLKIEGDWACFFGIPRYRDTKDRSDLDFAVTAILLRNKSGQWIPKNIHFHGDVPGVEEITKGYSVPASILPNFMGKQ